MIGKISDHISGICCTMPITDSQITGTVKLKNADWMFLIEISVCIFLRYVYLTGHWFFIIQGYLAGHPDFCNPILIMHDIWKDWTQTLQ